MNFLATLSNSGTQVNKLINANSWSACLAYCEGTGFDINLISQVSSNQTIVLDDPTSQNCYNIVLKSNTTNVGNTYLVFATNFNALETWIGQQGDVTVLNLSLLQKSSVTV